MRPAPWSHEIRGFGPKMSGDATATATVGIEPTEEGGFGLTGALSNAVPNVPRAKWRRRAFPS
jgi:hypothetical protein